MIDQNAQGVVVNSMIKLQKDIYLYVLKDQQEFTRKNDDKYDYNFI